MIYLRIWGGIGNQMFQFAAAQALAKRHQVKIGICLDRITQAKSTDSFTQRDFEIAKIFELDDIEFIEAEKIDFFLSQNIKRSQKLFRKLKKFSLFIEKDLRFQPGFHDLTSTTVLEGYFQSEKYFIAEEKSIREKFNFNESLLNEKSKALSQKIFARSVALHVRRGDYVGSPEINAVHGVCSKQYYTNAISYLRESGFEQILIFSDDPEWTKKHLVFEEPTIYVDWNSGVDSWQDMFLMSKCQYFVIANSSFSWWGAWLSKSENKKVIAPKRWFASEEKNKQTNDLLPPSWIKIGDD